MVTSKMSRSSLLVLVVLGCLACTAKLAVAEIFTALSDMENLLHAENNMVDNLKEYIKLERDRIEKLESILTKFESISQEAAKDPSSYLGHPVNAFLLVKRFILDWYDVDQIVENTVSKEVYMTNISVHQPLFPDKDDLTGTAMALLRLQDTYRLDTTSIADGHIPNTRSTPNLSGAECFELGRVAYNDGDNYHAYIWMNEALSRAENETPPSVDKVTILDYLAYTAYLDGDIKEALELTTQLLELDPFHERAQNNKLYYETELANHRASVPKAKGDEDDLPAEDDPSAEDGLPEKPRTYHKAIPGFSSYERQVYEALCRGDPEVSGLTPEIEAQLHCQYFDNDHPFLKLQPARQEILFPKPKLTFYHNILSDKEMGRIKELAQPRLNRATVQNSVTGKLEYADYRISKSAWLRTETDEVVSKVNQRIEQLTGLTMETAEELQVANYGVAGQYEPHYDFARKEEVNAFKSLGTGNRIATMLFYMSDVEAGGATVFPEVGAGVVPERGGGVFWYNLQRNGEGDYSTRHAACPVLAGIKWVSNKWIHEIGQEFRHQCGIHPDSE